MSSVEVVGHSEGLQYTNGRVLQVGVEGLGHDLRGERRLPWAALDVQVRRVAQGMHPGIGAARDGEPDRVDRVQPLGSLLQEVLSKAASSLVGRRPLGRSRRAGDEETDAIVEHLEGEDEDPASPDCEREEGGRRAGTPSARRVHLAALPERYDSLEEPAPGDKPKKRYRRKLKKYGKNFGKAISKGCRYIVIGLQGFAAAYSAPFGVATSVVSFVR